MLRKVFALAAAAPVAAVLFAAPAMANGTTPALTNGTPAATDGAVTWLVSYGDRMHVCDTARDGHTVYANWKTGKLAGTDHWRGGHDTCHNFDHQFPEGAKVRYRACEDINNWPDECSDWKTARA